MSTSTQASDTDPKDTSERGDNEDEQQEEETPRLTPPPQVDPPVELPGFKDQVAIRRSGDGGPEYKDQVRPAVRQDQSQPVVPQYGGQGESAALPLLQRPVDKKVQDDEGPEYKDQVRPEQVELTPSNQGPTPATVVAQLMTQEPVMVSAEPVPVDESIQNEIERLRELERQPVIQAQVSPAPVDEAPAAHRKKRLIIGIISLLVVGLALAVVLLLTRDGQDESPLTQQTQPPPAPTDQPTEIRTNEPTESPTNTPVLPPTPGPSVILPLSDLEVTVECFIAGNSSQTCDNYTVPEPEASQIPQAIEIVITFAADKFFTVLSFFFGGSDFSYQVAGEVVEPGSTVEVVVETWVFWSARQTYTYSIELVCMFLPNPNNSSCTYSGNATVVTGNPPQ